MSLIQDVCDNLSNGSSRDIENLLNCIDYCSIGETFLEETGFFVHWNGVRTFPWKSIGRVEAWQDVKLRKEWRRHRSCSSVHLVDDLEGAEQNVLKIRRDLWCITNFNALSVIFHFWLHDVYPISIVTFFG